MRLQPITPDLLPAYLRWFMDPEVTRYLRHRHPITPKAEEEWLEQVAKDEHRVMWAVTLRGNNKHIGSAALEHIDWRCRHAVSVTFIGDKAEWGKGYATDVMQLRTHYGFRELGLEKMFTSVIVPNEASRRALERTGYRQCGLYHRHVFVDGGWHDVWLGELLREEWEGQQKAATGERLQ